MKIRAKWVLMVFCVSWISFVLSGCGGSTNDPVSSDATSGTGYKINLGVSAQSVAPGGAAVISAMVFDPQGNPVPDGSLVLFSSSEGGTFEGVSDGKSETTGGVATAIFKAPESSANADKPQPSKTNRIFASFRGALGYVEIILVSSTF
jgi:hypothetical protein